MVQMTIYGVVYVHFGSFEQLSLVGGLNRNFDTSHQGSPLWGESVIQHSQALKINEYSLSCHTSCDPTLTSTNNSLVFTLSCDIIKNSKNI